MDLVHYPFPSNVLWVQTSFLVGSTPSGRFSFGQFISLSAGNVGRVVLMEFCTMVEMVELLGFATSWN